MIYFHWLFILLYVVIVVATVITVLLDNRQPTKTLTWILVLLFLPIVGFVFYFFFGQNMRKMRFISKRSLDQLSKRSMLNFVEQRNLQLPEQYKPLIQLFTNQNMSLPFKDNEIDVFTNGYDYFFALLQEIGRARHHIHIDVYIIANDALGKLIADALIDKAKEGLEVRLIYDDVGCWRVPNAFFERMRDNGIDVHAFMPVKFPAFTRKVNYRNHRKLCVVDGQVAFIGGMNIATRYIKGTTQGSPWRDTHLRVRGGAVYSIQHAFLVDWYFVDRTLITGQSYYPTLDATVSNNCIAQVVTSSPIAPWPDIMQGYVRILLAAKKYVYMETPYFMPSEPVLFALRTAAIAGVDVRLMIPRHSDSRLMAWASTSYVVDIVRSGVKVYLYTRGFNHSKLLVCDDSLCTCGSTNIDFRSFENNFEANLFVYDERMAKQMKHIFLVDQAHCTAFEDEYKRTPYPFINRLRDSLLRLLAPLL